MVKIIKQELQFEECLKQQLKFICEFSKVIPTFVNGSDNDKIRKYNKKECIFWNLSLYNFVHF